MKSYTGIKPIWSTCLILLFILCGCTKTNKPNVEIVTQHNKKIMVQVEIVATPASREQGLMYREKLPEKSGMLFFMPEEKVQTFWMKDTKIPLDIIFIYSDWKIAGIVENTIPYNRDRISIDKPSKYVLEVTAGFCKKYGIQAGDSVILHFPKD